MLIDRLRAGATASVTTLGVLFSGCAVVPPQNGGPCITGIGVNLVGVVALSYSSYDPLACDRDANKQLMRINDPGIRAAGILANEEYNPKAKESGDRVRDGFNRALVNNDVSHCPAFLDKNGSVILRCAIVTVPASAMPKTSAETAASAPAAAAPAAP